MGIRVIAGTLRGRRLSTIRGIKVRPTSDRVRESIFSILSRKVLNARVLDLFAGTGALGIEALSRGSEFAVFIESGRQAYTMIKQNVSSCGLEDRCECIRWNAVKNLNCLQSIREPFNLIFMDPPYNKGLISPVLKNLLKIHALQNGAVIVVEHAGTERFVEDAPELRLTDQRIYGKTLVSFLHYVV